MKYFIMFLIIGLCGCGNNISVVDRVKSSDNLTIDVVVIDSCQYLKWRTHSSYWVYCHKGNCTNHPSGK